MRLIAVDYATLAPLFEKSPKLKTTTKKSDLLTASLNKEFGSKRTKRITEQRERMKIDIENVKEQLEQTVAGIL